VTPAAVGAVVAMAELQHDDENDDHSGDESVRWCMPNRSAVVGPVCIKLGNVLSDIGTAVARVETGREGPSIG
jgi:hypothetical protein